MKEIKIGNLIPRVSARTLVSVWLAGILCLATTSAALSAGLTQPTGMSITAGYGTNIEVRAAELYWDSFYANDWLKDHGFDTRLTSELEYWHSRRDGVGNSSLVAASVTPMLRWLTPRTSLGRAYVDMGIGLRLLSHTQIDDRRLGLAAEFGERIGTGLIFGPGDRYEAGIYVQHVSNGRIKAPNNGFTYYGLLLSMRL